MAVDQASGDVFVYDLGGGGRIFRFDAAGNPVAFASLGTNVIENVGGSSAFGAEAQIAIAPSASPGETEGDIYVAQAAGAVRIYSAAGLLLSPDLATGGTICGVATDPEGHVYTATYESTIRGYIPSTNPVLESDQTAQSTNVVSFLCNLAVDGSGQIYAIHYNGGVERLEGIGSSSATTVDPSASTGAIDPSTEDFYADRESEFAQYDPAGTLISLSGAGQLSGSRGIAVKAGGETIYAGNGATGRVDIFGALTPNFEASAEPPSGITGDSAELVGSVNPGNQEVTQCRFEYGSTESYGASIPCEGAIPADEADHPVDAIVTGLNAATTYHFRLVVTSSSSGIHRTGDVAFQTSGATVENESATGVTFDSATLRAAINPRGSPTVYHFEYVPAGEFEAEGGFSSPHTVSTPVPNGPVGSDEEGHEVSAPISGLAAGTTYNFRVVASSPGAPGAPLTFGPDRTFVTRVGEAPAPGGCANEVLRAENASLELPDCRAYERVSPSFKNGGSFGGLMSAEGPRVGVQSFGNFAGTESTGLLKAPYEFTRKNSGWSTTALAAPNAAFWSTNFANPIYELGHEGIALYGLRSAGQPRDAESLYRGRGADLEAFGPEAPPSSWVGGLGESPNTASENYLGPLLTTPDVSRVVYTLFSPVGHDYLWPFDLTGEGGHPSVYEYARIGASEPILVGVRGGPGSRELIGSCGTSIGSLRSEDTYNAVSADGSTVFFTPWGEDILGGGCGTHAALPPHTELYARMDGEGPTAHTVPISEPSAADCIACDTSAPLGATFQGASEDGSKVFFLTEQELIPGNPGQNLYLYDFDAPSGQRVRAISHVAGGSAAGVQGVTRVSEDGSHVYFVAAATLTANPNSTGAKPVAGGDNLYVYDLASNSTAFVATLDAGDFGLWETADGQREAEATPTGRFLLFSSRADLTPDDTSSVRQLFRYDAANGALVRISVGRNGFNDNGNTDRDPVGIPKQFNSYSGTQNGPASKMISDDGAFVFFESSAGLTPKALDHFVIDGTGTLASNIYEYHDGLVSLISDGRDLASSGKGESLVTLIGTDSVGADVLFTTADALITTDTDTAQDVYDARVEGGFQLATPTACAGESCQGVATAAPLAHTATSSLFAGPPNPRPHPKKKRHKKNKHRHHSQKHKKHGNHQKGSSRRTK